MIAIENLFENKINTNFKAKVKSAERSNFRPIGVVICFITLGACELEHRCIVCKQLLHQVILGLDFAQDFQVGIVWNNQGQLYLHQNHKWPTYSKPSASKDSANFSVECSEARVKLMCSDSLRQ